MGKASTRVYHTLLFIAWTKPKLRRKKRCSTESRELASFLSVCECRFVWSYREKEIKSGQIGTLVNEGHASKSINIAREPLFFFNSVEYLEGAMAVSRIFTTLRIY